MPDASLNRPDRFVGVADPPSGLRCQWCALDLERGTTVCPKCGSPGVSVLSDDASAPDGDGAPSTGGELPAPWQAALADDTQAVSAQRQISFAEAERRKLTTYCIIGASVVLCMLVGWLAGPLLSGFVERLTGVQVEHGSDLRPMGAMLGLMLGFCVGATGGWVVWSGKV